MSKKSTLKLWDLTLKEEYSSFDKSLHKIISETYFEPREDTIRMILAYSGSVKAIKIKSDDNVLIFLN